MTRAAFAGASASLFAFLFAPVYAKESAMNPSSPLHAILAERAHVHRVDVYYVSPLIVTRTPIKPDALETFPEVAVHHLTGHALEELFERLAAAHVAPTTELVEYRWKLVFIDGRDERLGALYLSAIAPFGMTGNDHPVRFVGGEFTTWLKATYAEVGAPAPQG
jgi:hypothetical protein